MRERELKRKSSYPTLRSGSKKGGEGSKTSFLRSGGGGRVFLRCESLREERRDSGGKRGEDRKKTRKDPVSERRRREERPRKGVIFHVRSSALCLGFTSVVRSTRLGPARLSSSQFPLPARGGLGPGTGFLSGSPPGLSLPFHIIFSGIIIHRSPYFCIFVG